MSWSFVSDAMNQLFRCVLVAEEVREENMFTAGEAEVKTPSIGMWKVTVSVMIGLQVVWKFLDRTEICGIGGGN